MGEGEAARTQAQRVDSLNNIVASLEHARGLNRELASAAMPSSSDIEVQLCDAVAFWSDDIFAVCCERRP